MERDFWLAMDLLRDPKDHAEFAIVRDWVRSALQARVGQISQLLFLVTNVVSGHQNVLLSAPCTQSADE